MRAFSAKELVLRSKIEADSVVTAGILLSMFPESHAGCDLPFFRRLAGCSGTCPWWCRVIARTGWQKQGRKLSATTSHAAVCQRLWRNSSWCSVSVGGNRSNSSPGVSQRLLGKDPHCRTQQTWHMCWFLLFCSRVSCAFMHLLYCSRIVLLSVAYVMITS